MAGTINRADIVYVLDTAEFVRMNPSGEFIVAFYRYVTIKHNDKTEIRILQYWSECIGNSWVNSSYWDAPVEEIGLIKIV